MSFGTTLGSSFRRIGLPFLAVLAIIVAFILWQVDRDTAVPLIIVLPIVALFCVLLVVFLGAAYWNFKARAKGLPRVRLAMKSSSAISSESVVLLLEPSDLFSHNTLVSFYYLSDEDFEQLVGLGKVKHVQEDGKIQAEVLYWERESILEEIENNDARVLRRIRVKPSVPYTYLDLIKTLQGG